MPLENIIKDEMKKAGYDINNLNDIKEFWSKKGIGHKSCSGKILVIRKLKNT